MEGTESNLHRKAPVAFRNWWIGSNQMSIAFCIGAQRHLSLPQHHALAGIIYQLLLSNYDNSRN